MARSVNFMLPLLVLALLSFGAAGYALLQIPITKLPTDYAIETIERDFIRPEYLDPEHRKEYDFRIGWMPHPGRVE